MFVEAIVPVDVAVNAAMLVPSRVTATLSFGENPDPWTWSGPPGPAQGKGATNLVALLLGETVTVERATVGADRPTETSAMPFDTALAKTS